MDLRLSVMFFAVLYLSTAAGMFVVTRCLLLARRPSVVKSIVPNSKCKLLLHSRKAADYISSTVVCK